MIQVEFQSVGPGRCGWCQKEKVVYSVTFSDKSFVGPMCKVDLLRATEMKCPNRQVQRPEPAKTSGSPTVPVK